MTRSEAVKIVTTMRRISLGATYEVTDESREKYETAVKNIAKTLTSSSPSVNDALIVQEMMKNG